MVGSSHTPNGRKPKRMTEFAAVNGPAGKGALTSSRHAFKRDRATDGQSQTHSFFSASPAKLPALLEGTIL